MKNSQFSTEQIIKILEQAERDDQTISAICRAHGISETTANVYSDPHMKRKRAAVEMHG